MIALPYLTSLSVFGTRLLTAPTWACFRPIGNLRTTRFVPTISRYHTGHHSLVVAPPVVTAHIVRLTAAVW